MNFKLKPDNRNSSDENLIEDLKAVAKKLGKTTITRSEYNKHGRYSEGTLRNRFSGWINTLEKADLSPTKDYLVTDEELIGELQRIAKIPNIGVLSRGKFNKYKIISNTTKIERRFGSWTKALRKAGLNIKPAQSRYTTEDLFQNLLTVWTFYGHQPTKTEMSGPPSRIAPNTYSNHFGNWRKSLEAFVEYANNGKKEAFQKQNNDLLLETNSHNIQQTQHKTTRDINLRLRFLVMKRDDFKCKHCGKSPATDNSVILHVDHVTAWSNGGETVIENLQTLCSKCNIGKSNL